MSDPSPPSPDARARLIGRLIVIGFGILLLFYLVPLFLSFIP